MAWSIDLTGSGIKNSGQLGGPPTRASLNSEFLMRIIAPSPAQAGRSLDPLRGRSSGAEGAKQAP